MTTPPDAPYFGITVLDVASDLAGAYATMLLGDLGATVLRVDDANPVDRRSRLWSRSKRLVATDPTSKAGRTQVEALVRDADVVVTTMRPGESRAAGLDYQSLRALNPNLICCSMPPFGGSGPLADVQADDGVVAAHAGIFGDQGGGGARPVYVHLPIPSYGAAFLAVGAIGAALFAREVTGKGQEVETSLYAGALAMQAGTLVAGPSVRSWIRDAWGQLGANPCYGLYECSDGEWVMIACGTGTFWNKLCIALEKFEWVEDPRFDGAPWNVVTEHRPLLRQQISEVIATGTGEHWLQVLEEYDVPRGLVKRREGFPDHPQATASGVLERADDPVLGPVTWMAPPVTVEGSSRSVGGAATNPGTPVGPGSPSSNGPVAPLEGVRVVDLTGYIAGSYGVSLLADLGADVVKVESPMGDGFRMLGGSFQAWNRGKRGIVVDLRTDEGRELVYEMVREADVVAENFRPGTAAKLGVDCETLSTLRPGLVYLSVSGYGPNGPLSAEPAFDPLVQALSGAMAAQGTEGTPVYLKVAIADYAASMLACAGAVSALFVARRDGRGRRVETSLLHAAVAAQAGEMVFDATGSTPDDRRWGQLGVAATYRLYETRDGFVFLSCPDDGAFAAACGVLGLDNFAQRFPEVASREVADVEIAEAFGAELADLTAAEAVGRMRSAGAGCAEARHMTAVHDDPQAQAMGLTMSGDSPVGPLSQMGPPFRFSETPAVARRPGPDQGEHTDEVLTEMGYTAERIAELREKGAVA